MPPRQPSTKEIILKSAYSLFYKEGFSRVSVDEIANRANVTKRTIYYHFSSKDDIIAEVLDFQNALTLRRIKKWAGKPSGTAQELAKNLFTQLARWSSEKRWLGSGFTRISIELADRPGHPARAAASLHKATVEKWLEQQFFEKGLPKPNQAARQIMILIEGSMCIALIHGDPAYLTDAAKAAQILINEQLQGNQPPLFSR